MARNRPFILHARKHPVLFRISLFFSVFPLSRFRLQVRIRFSHASIYHALPLAPSADLFLVPACPSQSHERCKGPLYCRAARQRPQVLVAAEAGPAGAEPGSLRRNVARKRPGELVCASLHRRACRRLFSGALLQNGAVVPSSCSCPICGLSSPYFTLSADHHFILSWKRQAYCPRPGGKEPSPVYCMARRCGMIISQGSVADYRQAVEKAHEAWKTWREVVYVMY